MHCVVIGINEIWAHFRQSRCLSWYEFNRPQKMKQKYNLTTTAKQVIRSNNRTQPKPPPQKYVSNYDILCLYIVVSFILLFALQLIHSHTQFLIVPTCTSTYTHNFFYIFFFIFMKIYCQLFYQFIVFALNSSDGGGGGGNGCCGTYTHTHLLFIQFHVPRDEKFALLQSCHRLRTEISSLNHIRRKDVSRQFVLIFL